MPSKSKTPVSKTKKGYVKIIFVWIILLALLFSILLFPLMLSSMVSGEEAEQTSEAEASTLPSEYGPTEPQEGQVTDTQPSQSASESNTEESSLAVQPGATTAQTQPEESVGDQPSTSESGTQLEPDFTLPLAPQEEVDPSYDPDNFDFPPLETSPLIEPFEARPDRITMLLPLDPYLGSMPDNARGLNYNPLLFSSPYMFSLASLMYRPLYSDLDQGAYGLLESYQLAEDGKILKLKLKPQLFWEENQPLTVRDIEFTLDCLVQASLFYPLDNFVEKISGVEAYRAITAAQAKVRNDQDSAAEQAEETNSATAEDKPESPAPSQSQTPRPFLPLDGIKALNDQELELHFTADISAYLKEILALPILPARVWWSVAAQYWPGLNALPSLTKLEASPAGQGETYVAEAESEDDFEPEKLQELYAAASSGPYSIDFGEDSPDLELQARVPLPGSPFSASQVPHLTIRHSKERDVVNDLLNYQPDLALLPLFNPEDQARILEAGYKVDKIASAETLSLVVNQAQEDNPLAKPDLLAALYLLVPPGKIMQDLTQVPILAMQGECLNGSQPSLSEQAGLTESSSQLSAEERQDRAWDILLKAGYITSQMPEEKLAQAGEDAQNLSEEPLTLAYLADDLLSYDFVQAWESNLLEAGVMVNFLGIQRQDLGGEAFLDAQGLLFNGYSSRISGNNRAFALYRQAYFFASKRVKNFTPIAPHFFLGAENWQLGPED